MTRTLALVVHAASSTNANVALGAEIFFGSPIACIPIYYAGLTYVRTLVWTLGVIGLAMMACALV